MSTKKSIEITINAKGAVTYEAKGIKGASCLDETAFLEAYDGVPYLGWKAVCPTLAGRSP